MTTPSSDQLDPFSHVMRRWQHAVDRIELLSIGTAGADSLRPPEEAGKGGMEWARKLALFMIDVQEAPPVPI